MRQLKQWHPNYSVFVKELDNHHKMLIDTLNELYDAYLNNVHNERVGEIIGRLFDYAKLHFDTEEKYFEQFGYEEAKAHIAEHAHFLKQIEKFEAEYRDNTTLVSLQVIDFLHQWFTHHIVNTDRKYVNCFKHGGLK
ncbi:MAG TPA: bacteriohemerythrin [Bacteroidales bacterium]